MTIPTPLSSSATTKALVNKSTSSTASKITSFFKPAASSKRNTGEKMNLETKNTIESTVNVDPPVIAAATDGSIDIVQHTKKRRLDVDQTTTLAEALFPLNDPNISESWKVYLLKTECVKPYYSKLRASLLSKQASHPSTPIYPIPANIFSAFHIPPSDIRVVILGQDPYHAPGQAHGLSFSVAKGVPQPPSLKNIFRELSTDIPGFKIPNHGYLQGWANQGVFLLNASLTVFKAQPNSHAALGWAIFTDAVIAHLNATQQNIVFMLWGGFAQKKGSIISNQKHLVLKATHPSPLGANKGGWFGCHHFSQANAYLEAKGLDPIDWNRL